MASLNRIVIKKIKRELEEDLKAVQRVEEMLARRNGAARERAQVSGASSVTAEEPLETGTKTTLKQLCIDALMAAGPEGLRPFQLVQKVKELGYVFPTPAGAPASVSTVLLRLKGKGVRKTDDSRYVWEGSPS